MPLLATGTLACNSPVLGLYKRKALPVNKVDAVPVVAFANSGKTLVAVLVSLLKAAPPTDDQAVPLYPSNSVVVVLKRNIPLVGDGLSPVVPLPTIQHW